MTIESKQDDKYGFVVRGLPWLVAAGALVVYFVTVNPWLSLINLSQVGRTAGWTWQPELTAPAYFLATYPLRWLPAKWIPLGLNLFSVLCAVLTLAQLARSVALLPHDRTHEERERERHEHSLLSIRLAWVPPLAAVLVCGLQLTFWENATNGTVEMLDLLMFAWVIRALLEYRIDGRESWLFCAALVYGVGMTNNFALWGFLPLFIVAVAWVRGLSFFNLRFLRRMALFSLIGLSLYFLLPLLASLSKTEPVNFWQALKYNLAAQKYIIFAFPKLPTRNPEWVVLIAVCILPALLYSIRWPSYFGDTSRLGIWFATNVFHLMFGVYLCICFWCLLDAPFSPRYHGYGTVQFLTFYYMAALSVGYFTGYFLLVFSNLPVRGQRPAPLARAVNRVVLTLASLLVIATPVGLVLKNLPQIHTTNGSILEDYTTAIAEGLPKSGILLSDDSRRSLLVQAWLARAGRLKDYAVVDTRALVWPAYHRFLHRHFPDKWKTKQDSKLEQLFDPLSLVRLISELAKSSQIWYLHPSFGYYFEYFYPEPRKLVYHLQPFGTNSLLPPPLTPQTIAENEEFWTKLANHALKPVLEVTIPPKPGGERNFVEQCFRAAHLVLETNIQALTVGAFYSRALNEWGVEVQRRGDFVKAAADFKLAQQLNPKNIVAQVNLEYNQNLRAGQRTPLQLSKSVEDQTDKYREWDRVLSEFGPYAEPGFCYAQGYEFMGNRFYREAAQCFDRARALSPSDAASLMRLVQLNLAFRLPNKALELIHEIRDHPQRFSLSRTNQNELTYLEACAHYERKEPKQAAHILESALDRSPTDEHLLSLATTAFSQNRQYSNALATINRQLNIVTNNPTLLVKKVYLEACAHYARNEPEQAAQILETALDQSPSDEHLLSVATRLFSENHQYSNALATINRHLKIAPDNPALLVNKGALCINANAFDEAIQPLTRALALQTNNAKARLYRAISYLQSGQLDSALSDYETLQRALPTVYQIYYGLGEIAYRRRDTNAAIRYYESYLTNAVPSRTNAAPSPKEIELVANRIAELKGATH